MSAAGGDDPVLLLGENVGQHRDVDVAPGRITAR